MKRRTPIADNTTHTHQRVGLTADVSPLTARHAITLCTAIHSPASKRFALAVSLSYHAPMFWLRSKSWLLLLCVFAAFSLLAVGCHKPQAELPGDTDYAVTELEFEVLGVDGAEPHVSTSGLDNKITVRVGNVLFPPQPYNPYRILEDKGRIEAWFQNEGHFDVEVENPHVDIDDEKKEVQILWRIHEGVPYHTGTVELKVYPPPPPERDGLPEWDPDLEGDLRALIQQEPGDPVQMETQRRYRHDMEDLLREEGYGHATVYSRSYVDREAKKVHWVYFADPGPATYVGTIDVFGASKIPPELVKERTGLEPGDPFSDPEARKATVDLVDTGAYTNARALTNAKTENRVRQRPPDTGGKMDPAQIADDGRYVPRELDPALPVGLHVVEAPATQLHVGAGGQADIARLDALATVGVQFRNLFGPLHHLILEGSVGYGYLWRDQSNEPLGVYGSAMVRYVKPMFLLRLLDFRLTARFDDVLYPSFHIRTVSGGPGFRSSLLEDLFWDLDIMVHYAFNEGYGPFGDQNLELISDDEYLNSELQTSLIWDARNDDIEPTDGHYLSAGIGYGPGGPLGEHQWVRLLAEARYFQPIWSSLSFAFRGVGGWLVGVGGSGAPPRARFWGGGTWGFRGYGEQQFSSYSQRCVVTDETTGEQDCDDIAVGGLSTAWASLELRWLPFRGQYGFVAFVDGGGVGDSANPFDRGGDIAVGAGVRLRIWYIPISLDLSYRVLENDRIGNDAPDIFPFQFYFRIGEAF